MSSVNYSERIPNNVNLADDRRLRRALEHWQPAFLDWWREMGPIESTAHDVYLRTAISVDREGWANFGYTRMPDYRWGIFLADPVEDRRIGFGDHKGEPVWQQVPGDYRAMLRRLIVIQGDTEPASVEQQRYLGQTCPSNYDLRNLFQVNVEEGRHLWAMVYLLQAYFGRDGREEAEALLERRSGDEDRPRILGAFNERTPDWLSFYMFTFFTDRDGKFQLYSLAESGFDPLSRTARFMITEEAHHMFVGITGLSRVLQRTCEVMKERKTADVRQHGVIDLETFQKYVNFHFSVTLDLFGAEISTNAANSYTAGIKGRFHEDDIEDDHQLTDVTYAVEHWQDGQTVTSDVPALNALNQRLRNDFIEDIRVGIARLNRVVQSFGVDFEVKLPHLGFNRQIGSYAAVNMTPEGRVISAVEFNAGASSWLPTDDDRAFVRSLMTAPITEPGKFANWLAPPPRGINQHNIDFEYVRLD